MKKKSQPEKDEFWTWADTKYVAVCLLSGLGVVLIMLSILVFIPNAIGKKIREMARQEVFDAQVSYYYDADHDGYREAHYEPIETVIQGAYEKIEKLEYGVRKLKSDSDWITDSPDSVVFKPCSCEDEKEKK